jgi:hypothetical protein
MAFKNLIHVEDTIIYNQMLLKIPITKDWDRKKLYPTSGHKQ